ncbi:MAG: hypothetical protein ACLQO7_08425 [Candidatus Bathyarchaeia archaeon]
MPIFLAPVLLNYEAATKTYAASALASSQATGSLNLSGLVQVLSAISSIAVILGVVFIVVQLRQNAKLIDLNAKLTDASFQEVKSNISFEILEKLTDESFARRRSFMWQTVKRYQASNWEDFDDSADDFEIRNFAFMYDLFGQLAKEDLIDIETLAKTFKFLVALDWQAFEPAATHIMKRYNLKQNEMFSNFQWLANETEKIQKKRGSHFPPIINLENES